MSRILCFFEDDQVDNFYPLSLSHTSAELLCGILTLGDKWSARLVHDEIRLLTRPYLVAPLVKSLQRKVNDLTVADEDQVFFINARYLPDDAVADILVRGDVEQTLTVSGEPVVIITKGGSDVVKALRTAVQKLRLLTLRKGSIQFLKVLRS